MKLEHGVTFPRVALSKSDENYLFDLLLKLTVSHVPTVILGLRELNRLALHDFPVEAFLQRPKIINVCTQIILS